MAGNGVGSFLFGNPATGSYAATAQAATGTATTSGPFGSGGQFGAFQAMGTIGMGMGLMQAFSGGASTGSAPATQIKLSKEGEKLQKKTFETVKKQYETGLMPPNLASIYIGRIKAEVGAKARIGRGLLSKAAARRVRTGGGVGAALTMAGERMEGLVEPAKWQAGQREEEIRNALTNLQNIRNIELQTAALRTQGQFTKSAMQRMGGARRGAALGDIAQWLAMLKYPPYQT